MGKAQDAKKGEDLLASALTIVKESTEVFVEDDTDSEGSVVGTFISLTDPINALGKYVVVSPPVQTNDYEALRVSQFEDNQVFATHFIVNDPERSDELANVILQFLGSETQTAEGVKVEVGEEGLVTGDGSGKTLEELDAEQDGKDIAEAARYEAMKAKMPDATQEEITQAILDEDEAAQKAEQEILEKAQKEGKL